MYELSEKFDKSVIDVLVRFSMHSASRGTWFLSMFVVRMRCASGSDVRMLICHLNNGGLIILKRENCKLLKGCFSNCAPVLLGEQQILAK